MKYSPSCPGQVLQSLAAVRSIIPEHSLCESRLGLVANVLLLGYSAHGAFKGRGIGLLGITPLGDWRQGRG